MLKRVSFEVTGECNLSCTYCCRGHLNNPTKIANEISTKEVLRIITEAKQIGCKSFLFTGGEAFIKKDFGKILEACEDSFIEIYSNGTKIAKKNNLKLINKYVNRLTVTLDGLKAHNKFRIGSDAYQIIKNIQIVKKNTKTNIKINTLVNDYSIKELKKLYKILIKIGVDEWHLDFPQFKGRLTSFEGKFAADYPKIAKVIKDILIMYYKDNMPFFLKIYKVFNSKLNKKNLLRINSSENPCRYKTDYSMFINGEGKYILCPSIRSKDLTITTIKKNSLKEAIELKNNLNFQKIKIKDIPECDNCRYIQLCGGGCRGEAKTNQGSFFEPDLTACSLLYFNEKIVIPSLPKRVKIVYKNLIRKEKPFPTRILKNNEELFKNKK